MYVSLNITRPLYIETGNILEIIPAKDITMNLVSKTHLLRLSRNSEAFISRES